ncbi:GDP-mannose 4,6-dehydratase [Microbulbifer hainanensis]|uniref:GDP-mannose 4,6-dehydratase n=1 Tax=Microbulbifer hainanensis TaxID=2735675 RepID=UPI001868808B
MGAILVTRGADFIGGAKVRNILITIEDYLVNFRGLTFSGNLDSPTSISPSSRFHVKQVDICSQGAIFLVWEKHRPTATRYLATESRVDGSEALSESNVLGTYALTEAPRRFWLNLSECSREQQFRFPHISVGDVLRGLKDTDKPLTEKTSFAPCSSNSSSKALSGNLVRAWGRAYKLTYFNICPSNSWPICIPERLILILNALSGRLPPDPGDCLVYIWLSVQSHVRAPHQVATGDCAGQTDDIGGHLEKKRLGFLKTVSEFFKSRPPKCWKAWRHTKISSYSRQIEPPSTKVMQFWPPRSTGPLNGIQPKHSLREAA